MSAALKPLEQDTLTTAEEAYMAGDFARVWQVMLPLAEAGYADAQTWVGTLAMNGQGRSADAKEALSWFLKAGAGGSVPAMANAGALLLMGQGAAPDFERGVGLLSKAAEAGDLNALFNMGVIYSEGEKVPQDLEKAAACYREAAERGHYPSQSRLGYLYAHGRGVTKDRVQAYLWLTLAAQHGIGTALNALEPVVEAMSAEEKAEGMRLFDQWRGRTEATAGPARIMPLPS